MKFFIISCILLLTYVSADEEWHGFKTSHGKGYRNPQEEQYRRKVYEENKKMIEQNNIDYANGKVSYKMKMNQFGDLRPHEFKNLMNGLRFSPNSPQLGKIYVPSGKPLPNSVDWRNDGAVTPVKNQGQCGSCWAFSTTGSLEGQIFRKTGKLVSLSEQNLVDCAGKYGNYGCNGGLMDQAFQYIKDNKGIDTESSYPYEAEDKSCRFKQKNVGGTDIGFVDVKSGDEKALQDAVANIGPISVAIDAGHQSFQFYSEGIYNEPSCSSYSLDHGVLAVGYGTEKGQDYWLVKNSWGADWGEQGYIKMMRNSRNSCGIATQASYPLV